MASKSQCIRNCTFVGCSASTQGGAIRVQLNAYTYLPFLSYCLFYDNTAANGTCVYLDEGQSVSTTQLDRFFENCTVWNYTEGVKVFMRSGNGSDQSSYLVNCTTQGSDEGDTNHTVYDTFYVVEEEGGWDVMCVHPDSDAPVCTTVAMALGAGGVYASSNGVVEVRFLAATSHKHFSPSQRRPWCSAPGLRHRHPERPYRHRGSWQSAHRRLLG